MKLPAILNTSQLEFPGKQIYLPRNYPAYYPSKFSCGEKLVRARVHIDQQTWHNMTQNSRSLCDSQTMICKHYLQYKKGSGIRLYCQMCAIWLSWSFLLVKCSNLLSNYASDSTKYFDRFWEQEKIPIWRSSALRQLKITVYHTISY